MTSTRRARLGISLATLAVVACLVAATIAAPTVIKGAAILDHPIGKLAVENNALLWSGKFEESLKKSNKEYNDYYAALPADRKAKMAANYKSAAEPDAKFKAGIQKLGVLTIDGDAATLTVKETTSVGGMNLTSGREMRFTQEGGQWKVAP